MTKKTKERKVARRPSEDGQAAAPQAQQIPISAIPHLFNQQVLKWYETQHTAMKELYQKLDDILEELRRFRVEAKGRKEE